MRKLYLMMDEWDNDRNFIGDELKLICDRYDVTVICNSASVSLYPKAEYRIYKRPSALFGMVSFVKMLFDGDAYREFFRVMREPENRTGRLSEAVRFYLNADLFARYLRKNGFFENGAIYYSYWFFWKCYAVTHEIDKYPKSRVFTRTHQYDLYDHALASGYQPFKESMDEKLDSVVFIADHGRDYYLNKYNKQLSDKYKLYYLGTKRSGPIPKYERRDRMIIVSCSSIIERKRVSRIPQALALIDDINIKWIHFGKGNKENEVKGLAASLLDPKENIEYEFMGYVNNEDLHEFYRIHQADAFVCASDSEGNPVSVMEAMSYGIPVIASDVCNLENMIKNCGLLVSEQCRPDELSAAIKDLWDMPVGTYLQLRQKAERKWKEDFDAEVNNRRFIDEVLDRM